jgi:hypothetical protein
MIQIKGPHITICDAPSGMVAEKAKKLSDALLEAVELSQHNTSTEWGVQPNTPTKLGMPVITEGEK